MRQILPFLLLGFMACSRQNSQENNDYNADNLALSFEQGISQNLGNNLWIRNIKVDTNNLGQNCLGVSIHGLIDVSQESIDAMHKNGYDAFFFCWTIKSQEKTLFTTGNEYRGMIDKQLASNQIPFVSQIGKYEFNQHFPFANMGLPFGNHQIKIYLEIFPTRFTSEEKEKHHKMLQFIGTDALANFSITQEIKSPQLYKGQVAIKKFEINRSDKKKYDVTLNGKGYPDPFWELESGNQVIFSSKPLKNTYFYNIDSHTSTFLVTKSDTIKIAFYDFDQGPFNSKDLISEWKGTFEDLQNSKPSSVGSIQKLSLQYQFEKN